MFIYLFHDLSIMSLNDFVKMNLELTHIVQMLFIGSLSENLIPWFPSIFRQPIYQHISIKQIIIICETFLTKKIEHGDEK